LAIARLCLHEAVGETRAAALDQHGRAVGLFHDRWAERGQRLRWGQVLEGVIRKLSAHDGGAFIRLENGAEGLLASRDLTGLVEGAKGYWRVKAEARRGKLAKLEAAGVRSSQEQSALDHWKDSLPGAGDLSFETGDEAAQIIQEAFDDGLAGQVPLRGGGRLQISPTPALVAIDVDTLGRQDKGRASARAKAVGLIAAEELARQAALRGLGGALVLDCISPLARRDGPELKQRFVQTFRACSGRRVECLPPSPFGLMEAVLEWRAQPLHEAYFEADGKPVALADLLAGLRRVESEAKADGAARLRLGLPRSAFEAFLAHRKIYELGLIDRFGGRIEIIQSNREAIEVASL